MNLQKTKLSEEIQNLLCCPICQTEIKLNNNNEFECTNQECKTCFPIINGTPVLIDNDSSVFSTKDFLQQGKNTALKAKSKLERLMIDLIPSINLNLKGKINYQKFTELILKRKNPKILIIGGGVLGQGIKSLISASSIEIVESDVVLEDNISVICDAHQIPFKDNSLDGVIIQAVLEHIVDPYTCVEEIYRVLKEDGLVYSETPFMQQVHLGKYDFTRFTDLGHRRLFRKFEEISRGPVCGPGMALAWTYQYFLLSFVKSGIARNFMKVFARLTSFWLKYFDYYLINKTGNYDSASAYFFLGKKSNLILDDKNLLSLYRGNQLSSF